jgi:3-methyladenine DNA glycosylase AlkD
MTAPVDPIVEAVGRDLANLSDAATREGSSRFFKEPVRCRGAKTAAVRGVERQRWKDVAPLGKARIFALCEDLYRTGYLEDGFVAASWAARLAPAFEPDDITVFGGWVERYVDNWAACDTLCNHAVGDLLARFPEKVGVLREWARSENRWMRRAAAVSLVVPAKRGMFLDDALVIADLLLLDADDMVRKGYGWLLKEASRRHRDEVLAFVLARRDVMPRTALRYAIELMPPDLRAEAMRRV